MTTLHEAFWERTEPATLQCTANRRAGLIAIREIPDEAPWGPWRRHGTNAQPRVRVRAAAA